MRKEEISIYGFNELSPETQQKVIEEYYTSGDAFGEFDADNLTDYFRRELNGVGFTSEVDIEWSLSNCQGDGVAFYGLIDTTTLLENTCEHFTDKELKRLDWLNEEFGISIETVRNEYGYYYSHYNTMDINIVCYVDWEVDLTKKSKQLIYDVLYKLEKVTKEYIVDLSQRLESEGYDTIDEVTNLESIREHFEESDLEFLEDGSIY